MCDTRTLSFDDLERILDDKSAPAAKHIRAASEVIRRHELLTIEGKLSQLLGELARRAGA